MADSAKDLMAQNLGGSGDKKDASTSGGTVPPASDATDSDMDADDQDETENDDENADDDLPEGSKTAVIPPATDSFGSLDDEAKGKDDGNKTVNLRDGNDEGKQDDAASGGSGDSGGNKPPAPPSGGDGGGNEGGDGQPVNEIVAAMLAVKDKLGILVPAHEKANLFQDTIGVLLQRLKMYDANPPSDVDLTALKAIVATIASMVDAGHSRIEAAHKRPELDAALAYLKG